MTKKQKFISALFFIGSSLTVMRVMPITVINNTSAVIRVAPTMMQTIPRSPSFGAQLGKALGDGLNQLAEYKLAQVTKQYEHELQLAMQEKLMKIAHQQRLKEMAYQQELEAQKRAISITHTTREIGILASFVIIFFIIALFGAMFIIRRKQ